LKIGLIDNDLIVRSNHNFPNLALMKLSSYHKSMGNVVKLIGFDEINPYSLFPTNFDKVFISKAFTDSKTPDFIKTLPNVEVGGTGFYFDKAEDLPSKIEHSKPDYSLYEPLFNKTIKNTKYHKDYSIGYTTRGCFRQCPFCVNKNLTRVHLHSPIDEFYDEAKPRIAMLDDNILGLPNRDLYNILDKFKEINKPIQYRQGLDIRLLSEERIKRIFQLRYDGYYYFSFDMWKDKDKIEKALKLWSERYQNTKARSDNVRSIRTRIYVFTGLDEHNNYNDSFWLDDLELLFKRIEIILRYKASPYVMRFETVDKSIYRKIYQSICLWTNHPSMIITKSTLREFLEDGSFSTKETKRFFDKNKRFWKYLDLKL